MPVHLVHVDVRHHNFSHLLVVPAKHLVQQVGRVSGKRFVHVVLYEGSVVLEVTEVRLISRAHQIVQITSGLQRHVEQNGISVVLFGVLIVLDREQKGGSR